MDIKTRESRTPLSALTDQVLRDLGVFVPFILHPLLNIFSIRDVSFATQSSLVAVVCGSFLSLWRESGHKYIPEQVRFGVSTPVRSDAPGNLHEAAPVISGYQPDSHRKYLLPLKQPCWAHGRSRTGSWGSARVKCSGMSKLRGVFS